MQESTLSPGRAIPEEGEGYCATFGAVTSYFCPFYCEMLIMIILVKLFDFNYFHDFKLLPFVP